MSSQRFNLLFLGLLVTIFFTYVNSDDTLCPPNYRYTYERKTRCSYNPQCRDKEFTVERRCTWGYNPCTFGTCYKKCARCICKAGHDGTNCDIPIDRCERGQYRCGLYSYCKTTGPGQYECPCIPDFVRRINKGPRGDCRYNGTGIGLIGKKLLR